MARLPKEQRESILQSTRQRLMTAAITEFSNKGFEGSNVSLISEAAGVAKGTIYNYFPSKQAFMLAIIEEIGQSHYDYIARAVLKVQEPAARLEQFFTAGFAFVVENPAPARLMILTLNSPSAGLKEKMGKIYLPMFRLIELEILEPGIAAHLFRPVNAPAYSSLLMTLYLGTASSVDDTGKPYMDALLIYDFALNALKQPD